MDKRKQEPTVRNNNEISAGQACPDEFLSPGDKGWNVNSQQSIMQANARARLCEKDAACNSNYPMPYDPATWKTRQLYRERTCLPGRATWDKNPDKIF